MRILLLNDDCLPESRGGVAVVTDFLRTGFTASGHEILTITTHQSSTRPNEEVWEDGRGKVMSFFKAPVGSDVHRRSIKHSVLTERIRQIAQEFRPDVAHAHNVHNYLGYHALSAVQSATDHIFLTAHDTFLVSFGRVAGKRYERSALADKPYRMHWWEHVQAAKRAYSPTRNSRIKRILKQTGTKVIVYTHAMQSFLEANGITNTVFIPSGIPPFTCPDPQTVDAFRRRVDIEEPTILYGARISADKGIHVFLEAAEQVYRELPTAFFLIAGDRERIEPSLTHITPELRARIKMMGWMPYEELQIAYAASTVITTPSVYLDNFPTINLEAMRMGKPVVGTCFGGTPEAVLDQQTGYIVNPHDTKEYAHALLTLLKDPVLANQLGMNGKKRIDDEFSLDQHIQKHLDLFKNP